MSSRAQVGYPTAPWTIMNLIPTEAEGSHGTFF